MSFILLIHNVRSAYNVGSMFRTADGAGVEKIILTGFTPSPPEEGKLFYTPAEKSFQKTALGAERFLPWEHFRLFCTARRRYRSQGYTFIALEQTPESIDYLEFSGRTADETAQRSDPCQNLVLVVGNEVRGLDARIIRQCDQTIEIPMHGKKNSLNVAVAGGIALYHLSATIEKTYGNKNKETKTSHL